MHQPRQTALTAHGPFYELLSSTSVHQILLRNEGCSRETHLEVCRSIICSPRPRQLHGNEEPVQTHFILWGEHAGVVIFLPSEKKKKNEELWPDAHSLRGWKFNLEMAHISKPTIIGILCSVFLTTYISRFSVMAGNRAYMTQLDILLIKPLNP